MGAGPSRFYAADGLLRARRTCASASSIACRRLLAWCAPAWRRTIRAPRRSCAQLPERLLAQPGVRFAGNVEIGRDLSWEELRAGYDAVIVAAGMVVGLASSAMPGEELPFVWELVAVRRPAERPSRFPAGDPDHLR